MIGMVDVNLEGRVDRRPESQAVGCAQYEAASAARLAHDRSQTLDEVPGIGDVLDDGTLLHEALLKAAADVRGVDVDEPGIEKLRSRLGGSYTVGDLCTDATRAELVRYRPTVILASDVIELPVSEGPVRAPDMDDSLAPSQIDKDRIAVEVVGPAGNIMPEDTCILCSQLAHW